MGCYSATKRNKYLSVLQTGKKKKTLKSMQFERRQAQKNMQCLTHLHKITEKDKFTELECTSGVVWN